MFCTKCGANNADNATFCTGCGAPLKAAQTPVQPQAQPQQFQAQQGPKYILGLSFLGLADADPQKAQMQMIVKLLLCVGALLTFIGSLCPYMGAAGKSVNLFKFGELSGWFPFFAVMIIISSLATIGLSVAMQGKYQKWTIVSTIVSVFFAYSAWLIGTVVKSVGALVGGIHFHVGFWFMLIGTIAALAGAIIALLKKLN